MSYISDILPVCLCVELTTPFLQFWSSTICLVQGDRRRGVDTGFKELNTFYESMFINVLEFHCLVSLVLLSDLSSADSNALFI